MKKILLLILIFYSLSSFAQNPDKKRTNHWFFGQQAGLDFSSGTAVADTNGKMTVLEGSATMSDTAGNLLFYTDGKTVWNAMHDTMMNGVINGVGLYGSPRQGALIVPLPGSNNIYYIFTVDGWEHQYQNGLRYHIVDMNLDNGKGAVTQANITLFTPSTEQLAGVKDATGCGYWIVSHERYTDKFRAYHVTNSGVDPNAVVTAIGADYGYMASLNMYAEGLELNFSPNGNIAASFDFWAWENGTGVPDTLSLFQFNKLNGTFFNPILISCDTNLHGLGISPDNTKLYQITGKYLVKLYQYDISNYLASAINSSKIFIYANNSEIPTDFQNGPDGKLYGSTELKYYLRAIHSPNLSGLACNLVINDIYLGGRQSLAELPGFIESFFNDSTTNCTTSIPEIENSIIHLFPNPARDWIEVMGNDFEQVQLYDITGRLVYTSSIKTISPEQRINVSSFSRGIYIVSLSSKQKSFIQKVVLY
jgi:hypothetical protein